MPTPAGPRNPSGPGPRIQHPTRLAPIGRIIAPAVWFGSHDSRFMAVLFMLGLAPFAGTAVLSSSSLPRLSALGVYFDGSFYIEIARSFPLPYGPSALGYSSHAPGFPFLIALVHALTPSRLVDWGMAALLAAWLCAAAATPAFYALCRATGTPAIGASLAFLLCNPHWIVAGATAHAEAPTVLLITLALLCWARGRLALCMTLFTMAALTRYPLILALPSLVIGTLVQRPPQGVRSLCWLSLPVVMLSACFVYLDLRVIGFEDVWTTNRMFWRSELTWPFSSFVRLANQVISSGSPVYAASYLSAVGLTIACLLGFRKAGRPLLPFALWVALIVLFHASLGGPSGVGDFGRKTLIAWPPAALLLAHSARRLRPLVLVTVCALLAVLGIAYAKRVIFAATVLFQKGQSIERLMDDHPHWLDFRAVRPLE